MKIYEVWISHDHVLYLACDYVTYSTESILFYKYGESRDEPHELVGMFGIHMIYGWKLKSDDRL